MRLVVVFLAAFLMGCSGGIPAVETPSPVASARAAPIQDPEGKYKPKLDPSISRAPQPNSLVGKESLEISYDESHGAELFYILHFVDGDGVVHATLATRLDHVGTGQYRSLPKIVNAQIQQRQPGFLELYASQQPSGANPHPLAMIPIQFDLP